MAASQLKNYGTPKRLFLKRVIQKLTSEIKMKSKKLKVLNQTISPQYKTNVSLKAIIFKLQKENLIDDEANNVLLNSFGKHTHLMSNWAKKIFGTKYRINILHKSDSLLSLYFFSTIVKL